MKKSIKAETILTVFNILKSAKYQKVEDSDKIKIFHIACALKSTAKEFEEVSKDAAETMKPEIEGGFDNKLQKAQEYERLIRDPKSKMEKLPMGPAEYNEFITKFKKYNEQVGEALKKFADKQIEVDFEPLKESTFADLMASNDWNMEQVIALSEIVKE